MEKKTKKRGFECTIIYFNRGKYITVKNRRIMKSCKKLCFFLVLSSMILAFHSQNAVGQTPQSMVLSGRLTTAEIKLNIEGDITFYFEFNFSFNPGFFYGQIPKRGNYTAKAYEQFYVPYTYDATFGISTNPNLTKIYYGDFTLVAIDSNNVTTKVKVPAYFPRIPENAKNESVYEESCQTLTSSLLCTHHYNYSKVYFSVFYKGEIRSGTRLLTSPDTNPTSQETSLFLIPIFGGILTQRKKRH